MCWRSLLKGLAFFLYEYACPFFFSIEVSFFSSIFPLQVLRTHVMVRVGGGWDTLEHYLDKHDPCRCAAFGEVISYSPLAP